MSSEIFSLQGQAALVTGGSRGIGREVALALAQAGADVAVSGRSSSTLAKVCAQVESYGRQGLALTADVTRPDEVNRIVAAVVTTFGKIDIVVHSAGISPVFTRTIKLDVETWQEIINTNLTGAFLVAQASGQHMLAAGRGSLIFITSIGAKVGLPNLSAYCASKAGVEGFARVLALEWAASNVRVNTIAPAYVTTEMTESMFENESLRASLLRQTPLGRFATSEDIAGAAVFLAGKASAYLTGATIEVDGGWTAR